MAIENITVGTMAIARVGRNAIAVEVIARTDGGACLVRNRSGKEFITQRLEPMPEAVATADPAQQIINPPTASEDAEKQEADETPNPAPESGKPETPVKNMSLMEAAIRVLQSQPDGVAFNTRELVAMATEQGLWTPTGAKTPEQTLYGTIFREIATKEHPRIIKAEQKGKFRRA